MNRFRVLAVAASLAITDVVYPTGKAHAELLLSQLVVELGPGDHARSDVEVLNSGPERIFVSVEPREINAPGTPAESSRVEPDPEKLGLLVSPARMVLEPGQRKLLRIGFIASNAGHERGERVYRVTVKPVVGMLESQASGLKVLVGYDMLVLVRPQQLQPHVSATRSDRQITLLNDGNVSVELDDGRACDAAKKSCESLPGGRLYAGAKKVLEVSSDRPVAYKLKIGTKVIPVNF